MIRPQFRLSLDSEILVDNFAGGGGASTGIELGLGRAVDIAINHKWEALRMHGINHPQTTHICEDVFAVDPREVTQGRPVGAAWFSPDCTHFSAARGSKPKSKKVRGLAWVALRWGALVRPRVMFLENVREFRTWGPVDDNGRPIRGLEGRTFRAFESALSTGIPEDHPDLPEILETLGEDFPVDAIVRGLQYKIEWKEIRGFEFGAPTIRKRLFGVFRCDGMPIVWPEPTHGEPQSQEVKRKNRKPWRVAAECIDFRIPCPSIFLTKEEARKLNVKRPLVKATCRRLAKGVERYVMEAEEPFLVCLTHEGGDRIESVSEPFKTVTGANRGEKGFVDAAVAAPFVTEHANASAPRSFPADEPLRTACAGVKGGHFAAVSPFLAKYHSAKRPGDDRVGSIEEPLPTQTTENRFGLAAVHVARQFGQSVGHQANEPSGTITAAGGGKSQVVATFVAQHNTGVIGHSVEEPLSTLTLSGTQQQLVTVSLFKYYGTDQDPNIREPLHTVTTKDRFGVCETSISIPILTEEMAVMARQVAAFLREHCVEVPGEFATTKSGLVIWDIGMRMFTPRELYLAQGFPSDYIIDPIIEKNVRGKIVRRRLTKTEQIEMCGNSVCPPVAEALVSANVPELAAWEPGERKRREVAA